MKKLLSWVLTVSVLLALPTLAMAKGGGKKGKSQADSGETVTAVTDTTITVSQGGKSSGATTETITVPPGTPITDESGAAVLIGDLMGKHVQVDEGTGHVARSILVKASQKSGKKGSS